MKFRGKEGEGSWKGEVGPEECRGVREPANSDDERHPRL